MAELESYYDDDAAGHTSQPPCFILMPLNSAAKTAVGHVRNRYRQYQDTNTFGLWIDFSDPSQQSYTLGRGEGVAIYLPESVGRGGNAQISGTQASFELVPDTGAVLLWDHSKHHNTEPFSSSHGTAFTIKFQKNTKSVLVAPGINTRIAFGRDRYYQFELQWRSDGLYDFPRRGEPFLMGPRNSRAKRYLQGTKVGGGAYGNVWKVLDVTTGTIMAVKKFHNLSGKNLEFATREVANLFKINKDRSIQHEHILQIYDYAGGGADDNWGEIFMPLMMGNLKTLVEQTSGIDDSAVADTVLRQMLLALQCIASHKIVHRDIKPENILWEYDHNNASYHFSLGDFGLSNDPRLARTVAGTEPFMAPEVYHRQPQTTKVDIWSLFATVVWVRNTQGFRGFCGQLSAPQIHDWLVRIALTEPGYENIRTMAQKNPKKRPSASTQLGILNGDFADPGSYAEVASGTEGAEELGAEFGNMSLEDDTANYYQGDYGAGAGGASASPEMAYYEPYTSHLREQFPWEDQAGPSKQYMPPPDAPRVRQEHEAFQAAAYGDVPYGYDPGQGAAGGGGGDSGEGTTVPDMWTQRPLPPEEEQQPAYRESNRRKQKGKHKY